MVSSDVLAIRRFSPLDLSWKAVYPTRVMLRLAQEVGFGWSCVAWA